MRRYGRAAPGCGVKEPVAVVDRAGRASGGRVIVVTSRSNTDYVRRETTRELRGYRVEFDELFVIHDASGERIPCSHDVLNWFEEYQWLKIHVCQEHKVDVMFEDDAKVVGLFKRFAPGIAVLHLQ